MEVLPRDQIDVMNDVMDDILKHPTKPVSAIKKQYNLNEDEYQMIMDLTMPHIRVGNLGSYWKTKYTSLNESIIRLIDGQAERTPFIEDLLYVLNDCGVGATNLTAKIDV